MNEQGSCAHACFGGSSCIPTPYSMKHPLVHCGPYFSHILISAPVPGKTGHRHTVFTKLSTATPFHKIAYVSHSMCTMHSAPPMTTIPAPLQRWHNKQ